MPRRAKWVAIGLMLFASVNYVGCADASVFSGQPAAQTSEPTSSPETHKGADNLALKEEETAAPTPSADPNVLEIGEKMFITQINDIFYNFDNYKDKTIVVEGMFTYFQNYDGTEKVPVVYRRGPGCCGNDGWGGFLLKYDKEFPNDNDWIRVTGKPVLEMKGHAANLYLQVTSLEVKKERGLEFVAQ